MFANMNPPTDYGKKDLAPAVKARFHSIAVPEIVDADDLRQLVVDYLAPLGVLHLSTPSSRSTWM